MCEWFNRATPLLPSPCCEIFTLSIFATDIQDKTVFFFLGLKAKITSLSEDETKSGSIYVIYFCA